ncbi:MAG TPA: allantoinase AllB [Pyrinomonadaceae bacterium]|nr:allantoinase AllB [Pyrinomonadaceae bacterium]
MTDLVIRGRRVALPGSTKPASIHIQNGQVQAISSYDEIDRNCEVVTARDESIVMPGLVDTHVHVNEPGRTDWEGFTTATRAAAAGGVTTLVDMPLNSIPPTTTLSGFREKLSAAANECYIDVGFWGGVVPGNTAELSELFAAGVVGFKCFLVPSGVDEFANVTESDLREAMPELARLGAVLIVHAELPGPIDRATRAGQPTRYLSFLESRPRAAEDEAMALMIELSKAFLAPVHIVHHSSADALPMLRLAKASGVRITAETCPHYLFFAAEDIPDRATEFKCCPPIRERENLERLWQGLSDGTIDMVVSDHSPCPPEMKLAATGDFIAAWGGISSLQLRLPVMWTAARQRGFSVANLAEWLCAAPAHLAGLDQTKGRIAVGLDADIVIWNPERQFRVKPELIEHRHKLTPYAGQVLYGVTETTFLRGRKIYDGGRHVAKRLGRLLNIQ